MHIVTSVKLKWKNNCYWKKLYMCIPIKSYDGLNAHSSSESTFSGLIW